MGAVAVMNTPQLRRRRLVPWVIAVWLIALVGSFVISLSSSANRQLANVMAAADRDNPYWRLDDLLAHREQVPDAENAAVVVAQAAELLPKEWPAVVASGAGGSTTGKTAASRAYDRLAAQSANLRPDESVAAVLRGELNAHTKALALARSVGAYRRGRHELVVGPAVFDTPLTETQAARRVARLLAADAALRAEAGDEDGALESCRAILGTARSVGDEPTLISALVRIAIDATALDSARRVLAQGEPSDAALAQLEALILDEKAQPLLLTAVNGERAMVHEVIRRVEGGQIRLATLVGKGMSNRIVANIPGGLSGQWALGLGWMNDAAAIARRPTSEQRALWTQWDTKIAAFHGGVLKRLTAFLPLELVPAMSSAGSAFLRSQAELGATAILIAAERQRRATGKWPASIDEIDPTILPEAPADPFCGKPFHVAYRNGQFFVYSIGPNGKDEHGEFDPKRWLNGARDDIGAKAWDVDRRRQPPAQSKAPDSSQEG
jgi:hypothetical protein